jgi:hypothetical protein
VVQGKETSSGTGTKQSAGAGQLNGSKQTLIKKKSYAGGDDAGVAAKGAARSLACEQGGWDCLYWKM